MPKYLDPQFITDAAQMPIKKGTLQFLQDAHTDSLADSIKAQIGSSYNLSTPYVLWGCVNSGSGSSYSISAGAIFYFGGVYEVDPVSFTASSGHTAVCNFVTTQYTVDADPVTFTDFSSHNVHNIVKIKVQDGASGSGIFDFSTLNRSVFLPYVQSLLQSEIDAIESAWVVRNNNTDISVSGSGATVISSYMKYKIIGKTMFLHVQVLVSSATGITILIPASKNANIGFQTYFHTPIFNNTTGHLVNGYTFIDPATPNNINVIADGVSIPTTTLVSGAFTFEIA